MYFFVLIANDFYYTMHFSFCQHLFKIFSKNLFLFLLLLGAKKLVIYSLNFILFNYFLLLIHMFIFIFLSVCLVLLYLNIFVELCQYFFIIFQNIFYVSYCSQSKLFEVHSGRSFLCVSKSLKIIKNFDCCRTYTFIRL